MSRAISINGIGTRFYGISRPDEQENITATLWFTFLFFPVIPLSRYYMVRHLTDSRVFQYTIIEKQRLVASEVLLTYLLGWIVTPALWFGPLLLCIREVVESFGLDTESESGSTIYNIIMFSGIAWLIVFTLLWKSWLDRQGLPKNYKELLKTLKQHAN